jgi:hypothetical protein
VPVGEKGVGEAREYFPFSFNMFLSS